MNIRVKLTRAENIRHFGASQIDIDLEDYLKGVVPSEIYESESRTPLEAKKAQAIAARTYALAHVLKGTVIDDTTNYQAFKVWDPAKIPNVIRAVQETAGQVLFHGDVLITAWYSNSNGGRTRRSDEAWSAFKPWTAAQDDPWDVQARRKWGECKASHGVGMSQMGAAYAAFAGHTCRDILAFYYPGTTIRGNYGKNEVKSIMLNRDKLIRSFEEIIGWPYVSPGTNDKNGIDCSGAFVRAFRAQGSSIYHGSNRIIRAYCSDAFRLTSVEQLEPGMAVWKHRNDGSESGEYKQGGKYYDPDLTGNYYHIGLVASVSPLRIIHASLPAAKVDTTVKGVSGTPWGWAAHLDAVDYAGGGGTVIQPAGTNWGTVATVSGGLNMRETPGTNGKYMLSIPKGSRVQILQKTAAGDGSLWGQTQWANAYGTHAGWVSMAYVTLDDETDAPEPQTGDVERPAEDGVPREDVRRVYNELGKILGVN